MDITKSGNNFFTQKDGKTLHSKFHQFKDTVFPELSYTLMIVQYDTGKQIYNERVKGLHKPFIEWFSAIVENA